MRKNYIIKDARRILAEQIRDNGMNTMNKNPITNATGLSAIIPKDNDGYCTVYKMDCEDGLGLMTVYQVYPGIQLIYNDFEATSCYWDGTIDRMCWRSIIAGRDGKGAYCKAVPACTSEKGIFPFIQWITGLLKWPFL